MKRLLQVKKNIRMAGLTDRYSLIHEEMTAFLSKVDFKHVHVITSNPPYLPMPAGILDPVYKSINGGVDGDIYLEWLLEFPFPASTIIALEWSSLSNPAHIIKLIENDFDVMYVQAHRAPFGTYTGSRLLKPYLEAQRDAGKSVFLTNEEENHFFTFVGTILKKR